MLVYLVICLLISLFALQWYVASGEHSAEQRLLPVIFALCVLYNFYMIVDLYTGMDEIFLLLKYLLLLQTLFLLFFYVLDFTQTKLTFFGNIIALGILSVLDVFVLVQLNNTGLMKNIGVFTVSVVTVVLFIHSTVTLLKNFNSKYVHALYVKIYLIILVPVIAFILSIFEVVNEAYIMPSALAFFCLSMTHLMATKAFTESSHYLKEDFFSNFSGIVFLMDADCKFLAASDDAKIAFPEICEDLYAHPSSYNLLSVIKEKVNQEKEFSFPYKNHYYKGETKHITSKMRDHGYIVTMTDITDENLRIEKAEQEAERKSQFLAHMSHELRSPLHAIIGCSDIVLSHEEMSSNNRRLVSNIRYAGEQLLASVNSILDYSKMGADKFTLMEAPYDLHVQLVNLAYNSTILVRNTDVTFSIASMTPIPREMIGDATRVYGMLQNLVSNSIKYTKKGSITCTIQMEENDDESFFLIFVIKDTGTGISKERQEAIFEAYSSFGDDLNVEGTGLGLVMVKKTVESMQGSVICESDGKNGATFTLRFKQRYADTEHEMYEPFYLDGSRTFTTFVETENKAEPTWIYPTAKVLVVDDMKVNREILHHMVEPWKFKLDEVEDGIEAIELAKKNDYDLIILDQMMPNLSGLETADEIRKFTDIPLIMLSANISEELIADCKNHGITGFVPKPITLKTLKQQLEAHLPAAKIEEPAFGANGMNIPNNEFDLTYYYGLEAYYEELNEIVEQLPDFAANDLDMFRTKVHGIKGTSRQLNRPHLGLISEVMEMAAKAKHIDFINQFLDAYIIEVKAVADLAEAEFKELSKKQKFY